VVVRSEEREVRLRRAKGDKGSHCVARVSPVEASGVDKGKRQPSTNNQQLPITKLNIQQNFVKTSFI